MLLTKLKGIFGVCPRLEAVFAAIFGWKVLLLLVTALPVPSNDAFFYDGSVINFLSHGVYCNPALALALPISGTEIFTAYPPLYQLALLGWMSLVGTSVLSTMVFHLVLFGLYMLVLLGIFRQLRFPSWAGVLGGLFLFGITFHDRPDSLGHVFGVVVIYCLCRWQVTAKSTGKGRYWVWLAVASAVLSLCTSLQIGVCTASWPAQSWPWKLRPETARAVAPISRAGNNPVVAGGICHPRLPPHLDRLSRACTTDAFIDRLAVAAAR